MSSALSVPPVPRVHAGPPPSRCDVVVVGAGHNGLVAANYLADAGLDVVIVERRPVVGGMTRTDCPIIEAPNHRINHCAVDPIIWPNSVPAQELGLEELGLSWINVDPAFVYLHPEGESIAFWRDPRKTAEDIRRFSRNDAAAYLELAELFAATTDILLQMFAANPTRPGPKAVAGLLRNGLKHRSHVGDIGRFLTSSTYEAVYERFEHPVVRSALNIAGGSLYPASFPGSTNQMLILAFVHRFACLRPVGGTQSIPNALATRLVSKGGTILVDAQVTEIQASGGRARGVVLGNGHEIQVDRAVLTACDPRQTLTELVTPGELEPRVERRAEVMPGNDMGWGQLKVDIACSGQVDLSRFEKERTDGANIRAASHLMGTEDGLEQGYRRAAAGLLPRPEQIGFYNAIPNAADPSQTPEGQDAVYLFNVTTPAFPDGGWTTELREQAVKDTVDRAALFYGDLLEVELGRSSFTNAEMEAELGTDCSSHVTFLLNRFGPLRPAPGLAGFKTPIDGLYLGGAGSHPGAAVTGTPGYLGAQEVLRDLRKGASVRQRVRSSLSRGDR